MKKKGIIAVAILLVLLLAALLAACNNPENNTPPLVHNVTVAAGDGFTVGGINADGYTEGATVNFTVTVTDEKKEVTSVKVGDDALTAKQDGHYEFIMPAADVVITVTLKDIVPHITLSVSELSLNIHSAPTATVNATVTPASDTHEIEWRTSNTSVATVQGSNRTATITAVGRGVATITAELYPSGDGTPVELTVTVDDSFPWSAEEEDVMKEHLHGVVLYPTSSEGMTVRWEAEGSEIIAEGGYVEGTGLADYAAQYSAEDGWQDVTDQYSVPVGTAYIFEKAVVTDDGTRYVRVFVYAEDESEDFATEGSLIIESYDPYVYAWPADVFAALTEPFISDEEVPSVQADHYYISLLSYTVVAYYESDEKDGGYGAILKEAGWQVEETDGYYHSLSPDGMYSLEFYYSDGALTLTIGYAWDAEWPATSIAKHFEHYAPQGAEAFDVPVFEGASSYVFVDGYYNQTYINEYDESKYNELMGTVRALDSDAELHAAYLEKLETAGWVAINEEIGSYMKSAADNKIYYMVVRYVESESNGNRTEIDIYYVKRDDPTKGWQEQAVLDLIESVLGPGITDTIPKYEGTIISFDVTKDTIYVGIPEEDRETVVDDYKATITAAGYVPGENSWTPYSSPNYQIGLTISLSSSYSTYPNCLSIYVRTSPPKPPTQAKWSEEEIEKGLKAIGSSMTTIPPCAIAGKYTCNYTVTGNTFTIEVPHWFELTDFATYKEGVMDASGWTYDSENSTDQKVILKATDGTTLTAELKYGDSGNLLITITHPAE